MKICLIGWYGHNNLGDDRIGFCLQKYFTNKGHSVDLFDMAEVIKKPSQIDTYDIAILGGGGIIQRNMNKEAYGLSQIKPRLFTIGISVEAYSYDNKKFISTLINKSEIIVVRDKRSQQLLGNHFKVIKGHDVTFLYPFEISNNKNDELGVNLRYWPFWNLEYRSWPDKMLRYITYQFPNLHALYPGRKFSPQSLAVFIQSLKQKTQFFSFYNEIKPPSVRNYPNDFQLGQSLGFSNFSEDIIKDLSCCRFALGMRLHFVIFCIQMQIPVLCFSYQPKNSALLQDADLVNLNVNLWSNEHEWNKSWKYVVENEVLIKERMSNYTQKAQIEITEIMEQVNQLILGVPS